MKLTDLHDKIKSIMDNVPDYKKETLEVVLRISKPSIGASACVPISSVSTGFDWNSGRLFINTKEPVVIKTKQEDAFDKARDLLMWLATKPSKRKSYETKEAQDILKHVGYTEEEFVKYSRFFHRSEDEKK